MEHQTKQSIKETVMDFEKQNHTHLLFFKSTNGYYKLAGNSVLIYAGNVAQRIGYRYNIQIDTDHYSVSPTGIISFHLTKDLEEKLASIKITKDKKKSSDNLVFFRLEKPITDDELAHFQDLVNADKHTINKMIMPKSPIPTLYDYLKELNLAIYQNSLSMPAFARETIGKTLFEISSTMLRRYLEYANTKAPESDTIRLIGNGAILIKYHMKNISDLHILHYRNICRILEPAIRIEKLTANLYERSLRKPNVKQ